MKIFFIKPNQKEKSKHLKKGDFKFDINSFYKNIDCLQPVLPTAFTILKQTIN